MLFNSPFFLIFFPIVALAFYLAPRDKRWTILLLASIFFYLFSSPGYIFIPILISAITYFGAKNIAKSKSLKRKVYFIGTVFLSLSMLFVYKYFNFLTSNLNSLESFSGLRIFLPTSNLLIPLGISFYTFQSLSYVFEVNRKNIKIQKNFWKYLLYVMFFPLILSGPIERANRLLPQINKLHNLKYTEVSIGLKLIAWGLFKKVVIADQLGMLVDQIYKIPQNYTGFPLALATFFFVYQLYCDFSGYSDMARGVSKIFGINVFNNFNFPYSASSVSDFWRRWHISLSTYLNDYLYTPIALSLRGKGKLGIVTALFTTFILIGFWHGANWTFGIFGLLQAIAISYEILTKKIRTRLFRKIPQKTYYLFTLASTFTFWNLSCIFFRANKVSDAIYIISHMWVQMPLEKMLQNGLGLSIFEIVASLASICFLEAIQYLYRKKGLGDLFAHMPTQLRWSAYYLLILSIVLFGKFGQNKFIYFNF